MAPLVGGVLTCLFLLKNCCKEAILPDIVRKGRLGMRHLSKAARGARVYIERKSPEIIRSQGFWEPDTRHVLLPLLPFGPDGVGRRRRRPAPGKAER